MVPSAFNRRTVLPMADSAGYRRFARAALTSTGDDPIGPRYWNLWYTSGLDQPGRGIPLTNAGRLIAVGTPGVDGIYFGYRKGFQGLWAFYPIEREFKYMAATAAELVEGWCSGQLGV